MNKKPRKNPNATPEAKAAARVLGKIGGKKGSASLKKKLGKEGTRAHFQEIGRRGGEQSRLNREIAQAVKAGHLDKAKRLARRIAA